MNVSVAVACGPVSRARPNTHLLLRQRVRHGVRELDGPGRDHHVAPDAASQVPGVHEQVERREAEPLPDRARARRRIHHPRQVGAVHRAAAGAPRTWVPNRVAWPTCPTMSRAHHWADPDGSRIIDATSRLL
jgi:hypothetical protein